jgi:hypothetical protein
MTEALRQVFGLPHDLQLILSSLFLAPVLGGSPDKLTLSTALGLRNFHLGTKLRKGFQSKALQHNLAPARPSPPNHVCGKRHRLPPSRSISHRRGLVNREASAPEKIALDTPADVAILSLLLPPPPCGPHGPGDGSGPRSS